MKRRDTVSRAAMMCGGVLALSLTSAGISGPADEPPRLGDPYIDLGRGPVWIHEPSTYDPEISWPLVLLLHGYGGSGEGHEAYMQFAQDNALALLESCPNLVILRTFSKAFGLAGMRFGYCLCSPELAAETAKVQLPHHVNFFTQTAALTLLEYPGMIEERVAAVKSERSTLTAELSSLPGIKVYPSEANFLLVEFREMQPGEVFEALLGKGILVRNISNYPGLSKCLRITVGPKEDNLALVEAMREVLG